MTVDLTDRQIEVFRMIEAFQEKNQYPPTRREIAEHFGWKSTNAAECALKRLAAAGAIELVPDINRGIKLLMEIE